MRTEREIKKRKKKFAKLYDKYINNIYRFIYLKVDSKETAEDLTAEVFAKYWDKFKDGDGTKIKNVSAYLYQIARSAISNFYREGSKVRIVTADVSNIVDTEEDALESQAKEQEKEKIKKSLLKLSEEEQNIIILHYVEQLSFKEISKLTDKAEGTLRVISHRALKKLKEEFNKEGL